MSAARSHGSWAAWLGTSSSRWQAAAWAAHKGAAQGCGAALFCCLAGMACSGSEVQAQAMGTDKGPGQVRQRVTLCLLHETKFDDHHMRYMS